MKRLLCILSSMNVGGAETFIMKIYRKLDKEKYQIDFCINVVEKNFYEDEIISLGGRIYRIPHKSKNIHEFKRQLKKIVSENKYSYVMRITSSAMGFMDLKFAKKAGATVCIARSSNSSDGGSLKALVAHKIGKILYDKYVDVRIAPSDLAGKYTFGEKYYNSNQVTILHNGLDLEVFSYNEQARSSIRNEFNLEEKLVIGHVGRFNTQKNHTFLLRIFKSISQIQDNVVLLLVGKGELEDEIKKEAMMLGIKDKVIFVGVRSDIPAILSAMDVFIFPSFYEGMPNTIIEAQACGLPCVISDRITREAEITAFVTYLPLTVAAQKWAETALSFNTIRQSQKAVFIEKRYDIDSIVKDFTEIVFGDD